jgi:hypothetical protein
MEKVDSTEEKEDEKGHEYPHTVFRQKIAPLRLNTIERLGYRGHTPKSHDGIFFISTDPITPNSGYFKKDNLTVNIQRCWKENESQGNPSKTFGRSQFSLLGPNSFHHIKDVSNHLRGSKARIPSTYVSGIGRMSFHMTR